MKISSQTILRSVLWLLFVLSLSLPTFANDDQEATGSQQARDLWEQAIAAKGGRERLYHVNSLVISYQDTWRNFLEIAVHRGRVERLYVFPNKSWGWEDAPAPFNLSVGWLDVEQNRRCILYVRASAPTCNPATKGNSAPREDLSQAQYLYLMETRWVKPTPLSVTSGKIGSKKVDVLSTRFENKRVDYFLDRKTHLPLRVAVFYNNIERPTAKIDISEYVSISGIKMPGKQKKVKITFQINPRYDGSVFTRPPSVEAGPEGWKDPTVVNNPRTRE